MQNTTVVAERIEPTKIIVNIADTDVPFRYNYSSYSVCHIQHLKVGVMAVN